MNIHFLAIDLLPGSMVFFYVLVFLFVAFFAICWIAFPFIVLSKFNELLKVTRQIRSALNESNKGLQYLVDSAGRATVEREPARDSMR